MTPRRLSAGVVVARETDDGARLLLLRAYKDWDFPKGQVEPGEDRARRRLRETREEAGIDDLEFAWGEDFVETAPYAARQDRSLLRRADPCERISLPVSPALAAQSITNTAGWISPRLSSSPGRGCGR